MRRPSRHTRACGVVAGAMLVLAAMAFAQPAPSDFTDDTSMPSGPALLARNGEVLFEGARGIAERNHGVPMRLDSKLNLGSYFNDTYQRTARQRLRKVDDYKPLVAEETSALEPGTKWQYSNTGFLIAGAVIEAVTGRDYFDVVRERVYARAGMSGSDACDVDLVVPNLAIGYSRERTASGPRWRANTFEHVIRGGPAGGGYSTARDLLAFAEAMRKGRLVSAATAERLWSAKPDLNPPNYGFGFGVGSDPLGRRAGHSGGFSGISSVLDICLDTGWTVVVLSTVDGGMQPVAQKLREVAGRIR